MVTEWAQHPQLARSSVVRAFPTCRPMGAPETQPADSVGLCLSVSYVRMHRTSRLSASWYQETHSFFLWSLLKTFGFCCFLNMDFILKCGVSHYLEDASKLCFTCELKEKCHSHWCFLFQHLLSTVSLNKAHRVWIPWCPCMWEAALADTLIVALSMGQSESQHSKRSYSA